MPKSSRLSGRTLLLSTTLGGQTGLNLAMDLAHHGVLDKYGVEMIGANAAVIAKAEERDQFKVAMERIGLDVPRGETVRTLDEARRAVQQIGLPCVVRPSFTLGGTGSAIAYNREHFDELVSHGLDLSPVHQVLLEESVLGWKEYEMEVMRDKADNVVIICSIENFDPMGVHTGDSITVAPAQTLTDKEYQRMRDASIAVIREIGVETGGSNIQFGIDPRTGRMVVIEMNPRVSRSSALASKATGFPIAKIAAKLAVGYLLHELPNDITRETKACFEPTIDYVVVKIPRFAFEKFPEADSVLTTQMKSVGETMAIGRTFNEVVPEGPPRTGGRQFRLRLRQRRTCGARMSSRRWTRSVPSWRVPNASGVPGLLRYAIKYGMSVGEIHESDGHRSLVSGEPEGNRGDRRGVAEAGKSGKGVSDEPCCARPSGSASPTVSWRRSGARPRWTCVPSGSGGGLWPRSNRSIRVPPSSRRIRRTTIRPTRTRTKRRPRSRTNAAW